MDDIAVRLLIVLGSGVLVAVFAFVFKRRRSRPTRVIAQTGLTAGTYLFTSATCRECLEARSSLAGFIEISWEESPEIFNRLEVTAVPSTLTVDPSGTGSWRVWSPVGRNP